jgi:hypothetical protein
MKSYLADIWSILMTGHTQSYWHDLAEYEQRKREESAPTLIQSIDELIDSQPIPLAPVPPPIKVYAANLDLEKHKPHYTLNVSQTSKLYYACTIGGVAWNVPQPKDEDPMDLKKGLDELNVEFEDLLAIGLAKDVTAMVQNKVDHMLKLHGRHIRYFAPTDVAFEMFSGSDKRVAN